jgi:hypothetical protein
MKEFRIFLSLMKILLNIEILKIKIIGLRISVMVFRLKGMEKSTKILNVDTKTNINRIISNALNLKLYLITP